jgi:tryptophanase
VSGRDLMAAVCGLYEIVKPTYLRHRINQVQSFAQKLQAVGISVLSPSGGHAVYLDVDDFFFGCNRKPDDFAGVGLTIELLRNYGIRAAESGPYSWKCDRISQKERSKILNLVRFAVPRHTMSSEHIDYTVAAVKELHNRRHTIPTMEIVRGVDMKLRHFAASLKPVPVDTTISATHTDEASRQLALLGEAVGSSSAENDQLIEAFKLAAGEYGDAPVVKKRSDLKWLSDVSNDHAFLEYSVQIDQETGEAVLRFLIEAQPQEEPCAGCLRPMSHDKPHDLMLMDLGKSAMALTTVLAEKHPSAVSLDRMKAIEDLFVPEVPEGKFAAFHSCVSTKHGPEWKIYLNPSAKGSQNAVANTRETFERLGLAESWKLVESTLDENDAIAYFSLDLAPDLEHSRVKLYIAHRNVTAAKVADKHTKICPGADSYTIQQFCALMAGGSIGPYKSKSMISCFAFTSEMPLKPAGTVHFPSSEYAENDAIVQERMEKYIEVADISDAYRERYRKCVRAVQRRPLDQGRGIHAWISLKQSVKGKKSTTFYLSAELYGPLDESGYVMVDQAGA